MKSKGGLLLSVTVVIFGIVLSGCRLLTSHKLVGEVEVEDERVEANLPEGLPDHIYVADFHLDAEDFHGDEGIRGALPGRLGQRFEGIAEGLPTPLGTRDPQQAAHTIVNEMAQSITSDLNSEGIRAHRVGATGNLPRSGWLISGVFTELDEGNRIKRAVMGFGAGATQMDIQVGISDLASATPKSPFVIFGTLKDPSKLPGAVVTKNPYVAAAKFVLEKNATTRDVQNSAREIVDELLKFRDKIRRETNP